MFGSGARAVRKLLLYEWLEEMSSANEMWVFPCISKNSWRASHSVYDTTQWHTNFFERSHNVNLSSPCIRMWMKSVSLMKELYTRWDIKPNSPFTVEDPETARLWRDCPTCGRVFASRFNLNRHIKRGACQRNSASNSKVRLTRINPPPFPVPSALSPSVQSLGCLRTDFVTRIQTTVIAMAAPL